MAGIGRSGGWVSREFDADRQVQGLTDTDPHGERGSRPESALEL